jgi:hypothetical protein
MSNIFDMEMPMSFHEKLLYAQLAGLAALLVFYAHFLTHGHGPHYLHAFFILAFLLLITFRFIIRRNAGATTSDERDAQIEGLGARWATIFFNTGIVLMLVAYWDHGAFRNDPALLFGVLFHVLLFANVARIVRQLVAYRMSA